MCRRPASTSASITSAFASADVDRLRLEAVARAHLGDADFLAHGAILGQFGSGRAPGVEFRDLGAPVAQLAQDVVGVLAEVGRRPVHAARVVGELDREAQHVERPVVGWSIVMRICWWRICGSSNTSGRLITRPQGTPAALSTSSPCAIGCLRISASTIALIDARRSKRSALVRKSG
jgi:hypothetical protein